MFGQVKAINVLFLQFADVYCPQEVLHFIHDDGRGTSAQVRLLKVITHSSSRSLFSSVSLYHIGGFLYTAPSSRIEFHCSTVFDLWQEEILQASPADSIYNDPRGVHSREVSSAAPRCPGF